MKIKINDLEDIQNFISNRIKESLYLEYKSKEKKPKDLMKHVCAFANVLGGTIVYGIDEEDGVPVSISWMKNKQIKEKIEHLILSNIQPKFEKYIIKQIDNPSDNSQSIFIIDIDESPISPHMTNYRYYVRRNFETEPMEDYEVKNSMFDKGIRDALLEEIEYNFDLAEKTIKKINNLYPFQPEDRKFLALIPFRVEAWRNSVSSGLFNIIKHNQKELIDAYNLIYEANNLMEYQKHGYGHYCVVTQKDDSKPKAGTYLPALIREISEKIIQSLPKFID